MLASSTTGVFPMKFYLSICCVAMLRVRQSAWSQYKGDLDKPLKALGDKDDGIRAKAAFALGKIGPDPKLAVKPLLKLLTEGNADVRRSASEALGQFKAAAVPGLIEALKDDVVSMKIEAALALGQIGPDAKAALLALKFAAT